VLVAELNQITHDGQTAWLRQPFDEWNIRSVEIANEKIDHRDDGDADGLKSHDASPESQQFDGNTRRDG
jgi:hypothetical protein